MWLALQDSHVNCSEHLHMSSYLPHRSTVMGARRLTPVKSFLSNSRRDLGVFGVRIFIEIMQYGYHNLIFGVCRTAYTYLRHISIVPPSCFPKNSFLCSIIHFSFHLPSRGCQSEEMAAGKPTLRNLILTFPIDFSTLTLLQMKRLAV